MRTEIFRRKATAPEPVGADELHSVRFREKTDPVAEDTIQSFFFREKTIRY
jgi:hypothetical protein